MTRAWIAAAAVSALAGTFALACEPSPSTPTPTPDPIPDLPDAEPPPPPDPLYPREPGDLAPSMVRVVDGEIDVDRLADVDTCDACHADVHAQWRQSAHGRSSFDNPWYRQAVDAFRADAGNERSRFCAGCHDPVLLLSGRIDGDVAPDDPSSHAGITCLVCHSVRETSTDGNASYTLTAAPVPLPREGDPASVRAHIARVALDPLREARLCGTCHRVFMGHAIDRPVFLEGVQDIGQWRASAYAGSLAERVDEPIEETTCQGCHMTPEAATRGDRAATDGMVRSHRFPGGQTALASQSSDPAQLEAVRAMLRRAATIDVAAVWRGASDVTVPADGAHVRAGDHVEVDVVIRNQSAGHAFPGSVRDTQDTWVEVRVFDAHGEPIASAGDRYATGDDDTAHVLRTTMITADGSPELRHHIRRFEALGYDHTIGPRDAGAARYAFDVPRRLPRDAFPLHIEARLRHRRHARPLVAAACAASASRRGRAFRAESESLERPGLDACVTEPITDLATATVYVGAGSEGLSGKGGAARPAWLRAYEHALALSHDVQERLDSARPAIARALALIGEGDEHGSPEDESQPPDVANALRRAMVLTVEGRIEGRQGRVDAAIEVLDRAEALIGAHPAIARARGDAYAQVWRWPEAADAYEASAEATPLDVASFRMLARARGSARQNEAALAAAQRGLLLLPRDEGLLRTQAVVLDAMHHEDAARARELFVLYRHPDQESELRLACARNVSDCGRDRQPVPVIEMR